MGARPRRPAHHLNPAMSDDATDDTPERSAELLRMALPLMSRHGDGYQPVSYAVWYEYVAGGNDALKQEVDATLRKGQRLTASVTFDLYQRHLIDRVEQAVQRARNGLLGVLEKVHTSVADASAGAAEFDADLRRFGERLAGPEDTGAISDEVVGMMDKARRMGDRLGQLQAEFDRSQGEVEQLSKQLSRMRQEVQTDALTGLANRRGFDTAIRALTEGAQKDGTDLTLLMIDIDLFKKVNDTYGHLFGDQVIRGVAEAIRSAIKGQDVGARYGGEEFAVLLPRTRADGGLAVAEQIRSLVERSRIRRFNSPESVGNITISIGVAQWTPGDSPERFVEQADAALYQSKSAGRNRVTVS